MNRWDMEFKESRYIKDKQWRTRVLTPITNNLAQYIDKYAKDRLELPYKQSHVRQIFINKNTEGPQTFSNNRPISITSTIYKVIEIMINKRMIREEKENNIKKLNINQIGF